MNYNEKKIDEHYLIENQNNPVEQIYFPMVDHCKIEGIKSFDLFGCNDNLYH